MLRSMGSQRVGPDMSQIEFLCKWSRTLFFWEHYGPGFTLVQAHKGSHNAQITLIPHCHLPFWEPKSVQYFLQKCRTKWQMALIPSLRNHIAQWTPFCYLVNEISTPPGEEWKRNIYLWLKIKKKGPFITTHLVWKVCTECLRWLH